MPSLQEWLQDVVNGWPVIWANKATLIPILVGVIVIVWGASKSWYNREIKFLDRQLADYREKLKGATPEEAKARIDALEEGLRQIEPRRLTDDQRKILIERAHVNDHELTIIFEASSDCPTYAAAFETTLREAGWVVYNWQIINPPRRPRSGTAVQVPDLKNLSKEAGLLWTALQAAQVNCELMNMKDFPPKSPYNW